MKGKENVWRILQLFSQNFGLHFQLKMKIGCNKVVIELNGVQFGLKSQI